MIFDSDVLIWVQKNNSAANRVVDSTPSRFISIVTCMELTQGARNAREAHLTRGFLQDLNFSVLPLTENIGHRALMYLEQFALSHGMYLADALIAATAVENSLQLCSGNSKHFKAIKELSLKAFKP